MNVTKLYVFSPRHGKNYSIFPLSIEHKKKFSLFIVIELNLSLEQKN